jgi:hypothetical protein
VKIQHQGGDRSEEQTAEAAPMETAPEIPTETTSDSRSKTHGVLESYFASNAYGSSYVGLNFAVATPFLNTLN